MLLAYFHWESNEIGEGENSWVVNILVLCSYSIASPTQKWLAYLIIDYGHEYLINGFPETCCTIIDFDPTTVIVSHQKTKISLQLKIANNPAISLNISRFSLSTVCTNAIGNQDAKFDFASFCTVDNIG